MIRSNFKQIALSALILTLGTIQTGFAQDEYDDMYFSKKDRKKIKHAEENTDANVTYTSYSNNTYSNATYSAKEVNPEYIEKYKQQAQASVASEIIAAEGSANPTYSSQDYYVDEFDNQTDESSVYNDPKYNRPNESTVANNNSQSYGNLYYGGFNSMGPAMNMGYSNRGGWSYGVSYSFGWGSCPSYYDPFYYDPFYCPVYSYNSYRWYSPYYAYDRGYYNGYQNGYYAGASNPEYHKNINRGSRYSRGTTVTRNENIAKLSSTRPARSSSGRSAAVTSNGRTNTSARTATSSSSRSRVSSTQDRVGSQNEYLRRANVSTSRSRLSDVSNRTSSRTAVTSRTPYARNTNRTSSSGRAAVVSQTGSRSQYSVGTNARNTRSNSNTRSYSNNSGNQRRYSTQRSSSSSSFSGGRTTSPNRSYSAPSRSSGSQMRSSPSRSTSSPSRSSGSSSRSSRGNR